MFAGYGGVEAYLPFKKIAIAVVTTYGEGRLDDKGNYKYGSVHKELFDTIGAYLAPDEPPPAAPH